MPVSDGKRTAIASYTWGGWGSQNDLTQFRDVFQPEQGIFSPSYPLVPPERERVRLWDFPVGYNTVVVAYTAGYATTPLDVAQACIELVALRYRERTRIGEVSRSLGGAETVSYSQKDMSDGTRTLLQQYRLVAPIVAIRPTEAPTSFDVAIVAGIL
jgi:hypothetical protein